MSTIINNAFAINGVVSTDRTVLQNINRLCSAANAWMTYDISDGLWSVVINEPGSPVAAFDNSNIIGGINVSGTGVGELYNAASIEFPHRDIKDQTDYIDVEVASADRFPNELDNRLNLSFDCVNNPIQAQYIATVQLKQSRVDKVIEFRTDYNTVGLKAGDLISVTNDVYDYSNKIFRIVKLEENDDEFFTISISALEYDADVYDDSDLVYTSRNKKTGIVPKAVNTATTASDNQATATSNAEGANDLLTPAAIAAILAAGAGPLFDYIKTLYSSTSAGATAENPGTIVPSLASAYIEIPEATVLSEFNAFAGNVEDQGFVGDNTAGVNFTFTLPVDFTTVVFTVQCPYVDYLLLQDQLAFFEIGNVPVVDNVTYTQFPELSAPVVTDISFQSISVLEDVQSAIFPENIEAYVPLQGTVLYNGTQFLAQFSGVDTSTMTFTVPNAPAGEYTLVFQPSPIYAVGSSADNLLTYHGYYNATGLGNMFVTVLAFK